MPTEPSDDSKVVPAGSEKPATGRRYFRDNVARRTPRDVCRSGKQILPEAQPTNLYEAATYMNAMWCGLVIQRLTPSSVVERLGHIQNCTQQSDIRTNGEFYQRWGIHLVKPLSDSKDRRDTIHQRYGDPLWRGRVGQSGAWTYGGSIEDVMLDLCDFYERAYVTNDNRLRWDSYTICRMTMSHLPTPESLDKEFQTCSKCRTEYRQITDNRIEEINPPFDPTEEHYPPPLCHTYRLDADGNVTSESHLVMWATWMVSVNRKLLTTTVGPAAVVTEFRGYCDRQPPLLFDTYILVDQQCFPVARHATKVEAVVCHDTTAAQLEEQYETRRCS